MNSLKELDAQLDWCLRERKNSKRMMEHVKLKGDYQFGIEYPDNPADANLAGDLPNWMGKLPEQLRKTPLIHLAIPGSHDSGTFNINGSSGVSPDADYYLRRLRWVGFPAQFFTSKWAKTQDFDINMQLNSGVRFFDLRVATKQNDSLHIVHSLYAGPIADILDTMNTYLNEHPNEVIILDFQHFYEMHDKDHSHLVGLILAVFDQKIIPAGNYQLHHLTLDYLAENRLQVLIVYRTNRFKHPFFPSGCYPTPWPNTTDSKELVEMLTRNLSYRNNSFGYVTQFLLTPTAGSLMWYLLGGLKSFTIPLLRNYMNWVRGLTPGHSGVNVIISDFVNMYETDFCKTVINLNKKLLKREDSMPNTLPTISS